MDHMMPEMDGIEATAAIRRLGDDFRTLPIIALTANAVTGMKEMFLAKGFNDYLSKPIGIAKLDAMIARWIPPEKKQIAADEQLVMETEEEKDPEAEKQLAARYLLLIHLGVDIKNGIALTGGTEAGYRKILASFSRDAEERLPALEGFLKDLAEGNPDEKSLSLFTSTAHGLKGAAGTIRAAAVSKAAAELEAAGKAGDRDLIKTRLPGFCQELGALTVGIGLVLNKDLSENVPGEGAGEFSGEGQGGAAGEYLPLFRELSSALEHENIETIDRLIMELEGRSLDAKTRAAVGAISDQVLITEFKAARAAIEKLLNALGA
jgi:CheY-like chemotaxis protein